jgi:hypothetical protein
MERIVNGIVFEGKPLEDCWEVRTWTKNGVMERSARQLIEWREVGEYDPDALHFDACGNPILPSDPTVEELEERRLRSLKKAAQRAKTMCRRVIISEGFNELLTLTYRENQADRALCKQHFAIWMRRMKAALGGFRFCASFEVQERGAMHVHVATHRLPVHGVHKGTKIKAWKLGTKIWREIVGANNGLCFVGGKPKFAGARRRNMSLAKMAAYVSKYILKDFENAPEESNRYSRSNGTVIGEVHTLRLTGVSCFDLIGLIFECGEGDVIVSHRVNRWNDAVWLCTERDSQKL